MSEWVVSANALKDVGLHSSDKAIVIMTVVSWKQRKWSDDVVEPKKPAAGGDRSGLQKVLPLLIVINEGSTVYLCIYYSPYIDKYVHITIILYRLHL